MVPLQLADDFGRVHRSDTRQPQDGAAHLARGSQLVLPRGRRLSAVRAVVAEPFGAAMAITRYQRRSRRLNDEQASHRLRLCTSTPPPPSDMYVVFLGAHHFLPSSPSSSAYDCFWRECERENKNGAGTIKLRLSISPRAGGSLAEGCHCLYHCTRSAGTKI